MPKSVKDKILFAARDADQSELASAILVILNENWISDNDILTEIIISAQTARKIYKEHNHIIAPRICKRGHQVKGHNMIDGGKGYSICRECMRISAEKKRKEKWVKV